MAYALAQGDRRLVPDKPVVLTLNFRSHSGPAPAQLRISLFDDFWGVGVSLYAITRHGLVFKCNWRIICCIGVLDVAAAVLDKLFFVFPGAATKLPHDQGLFKGPRPGLTMLEGHSPKSTASINHH